MISSVSHALVEQGTAARHRESIQERSTVTNGQRSEQAGQGAVRGSPALNTQRGLPGPMSPPAQLRQHVPR